MQKKIGIVTVLYNSGQVLDEFFSTLELQSYRNFALYVIDNHSPDDSLRRSRELAERASFETVILAEPENWGVAKGNNIGILRALEDGCDYILLSNNDIVLEQDTILRLYEGMQNHGATMAVPKIYFHDSGLIWAAGGRYNSYNLSTPHFGNMEPDRGQYDQPREVTYAPTCFMLIDKGVFGRIGYMDENYFVYYDDTDFVWRAVVRNTERLAYIPSSRLRHKESSCTGSLLSDFKLYYVNRNVIYFARKNLTWPRRSVVYAFYLLHYLLRKSFYLDRSQRALVRKAHRDGRRIQLPRPGK